MRLLLALALALTPLALSGCIAGAADGSIAAAVAGQDCSDSIDQQIGHTMDPLLPSAVPSERPSVSVTVREGQQLVASATWQATAGRAQAVFDGPSQHVVHTEGTWMSVTPKAPAGTYTLGLEGAPLAESVRFTLSLVAVGCTPA